MTRKESIKTLQQIVKKIDEFYAGLKDKYKNCENNLEMQGFISYSQFIKTNCLRLIEQFSNQSDAEFAESSTTVDF